MNKNTIIDENKKSKTSVVVLSLMVLVSLEEEQLVCLSRSNQSVKI